MFRLTLHHSGQAIFVYAVILVLVALALGAMRLYLRRSIQAGIKMAADEIGVQQEYIEQEPTKRTFQHSIVQRLDSATRRLQELAGRHALTVIETSEIYYGQSRFWSGFEEED